MAKKLVLVHTVAPLVDTFNRLGAEILPGVQLVHIVDEPLLQLIRRRGLRLQADTARLRSHLQEALDLGADGVLVTCSTVSPYVDRLRVETDIPVGKIDEAMVAEAVRRGGRIGVVATNEATLEPTARLLSQQAELAGRPVQTELVLVEGAYDALLGGDAARHDRLVQEAIDQLAERAEVVVLAQASMARVLEGAAQGERGTPVLASPPLALQQMREWLGVEQA